MMDIHVSDQYSVNISASVPDSLGSIPQAAGSSLGGTQDLHSQTTMVLHDPLLHMNTGTVTFPEKGIERMLNCFQFRNFLSASILIDMSHSHTLALSPLNASETNPIGTQVGTFDATSAYPPVMPMNDASYELLFQGASGAGLHGVEQPERY